MKAAIIGLGVEGKKASASFLQHDWQVYATDLNNKVDLSDFEIPLVEIDLIQDDDNISMITGSLTVDLGFFNSDEIDSSDVVAISPSMWGSAIAQKYLEEGKLLCDVLTAHKDIFTIGITGTNGKTTTVHMLKEILEESGKKVLVGGNAGGGFEGYYDLILKANSEDYDILLVEVCDMTLEFCDYFFNFDLLALTNIGNDHMDVHKTIANYKNKLMNFFKGKEIVLAHNQDFQSDFRGVASKSIPYYEFQGDLKIWGNVNKLNAGLATAIATYLKIPKNIIKDVLSNFEPVQGRLNVYKLNDSLIYIGKTDNVDATLSILNEKNFYATFIGTPRANEYHRLEIIDEIAKYHPEVVVLFSGLDDTIDMAVERFKELQYDGRIEIANTLDDIIFLLAEFSHEEAIFIGGNGQNTIIEIQERLKLLSDNCNNSY
ncbi:MAG: UDP-N-acetylmuramoylalanine--D-glutamate ligase [Methanobacteriaceae archaeon]|jgi:UDP-N-acetylmuramoylalanine--D-glutamate ligase|nr:UDP-N-acetylmuramoylalanine--D-glutamate ligase [Methanobacteriaceae archaeon]